MTKYIITYPIVPNDTTTNGTELTQLTVYTEELANRIVDEILHHRASGEKSAYMLHLEHEFAGKFKQTSRSVIYIDKVVESRIRKEGGVYDIHKQYKNN